MTDRMNETDAQRKARIAAEIEAAWIIRAAQKRGEMETLSKVQAWEGWEFEEITQEEISALRGRQAT